MFFWSTPPPPPPPPPSYWDEFTAHLSRSSSVTISILVLLASVGIFWRLSAAAKAPKAQNEKTIGRALQLEEDAGDEGGDSDSESEPSLAGSDDQDLSEDEETEVYDSKGYFCDMAFRPGLEALGNFSGDSANKAKGKVDKWQQDMVKGWVRPYQMCGQNRTHAFKLYGMNHVEPRLFGHTAPNDLRQGSLGDCWLITAMSSIAEFPSLVQRLFKQQELAVDGRYDIRLYDEETERWHVVTIDDRLPFMKKPGCYGRTIFCKPSKEGEFWPCLLEKAFAKFLDGYWRLEGGFIGIALVALTGKPSVYMKLRDADDLEKGKEHKSYEYLYGPDSDNTTHKCLLMRNPGKDQDWGAYSGSADTASWERGGEEPVDKIDDDEMWEKIKTWDSQGFLMGASSRSNYNGIIRGHAYSLIRAVEVEVEGHDEYTSLRLVKIRNPHAGNEWTGPFSDADEESWNAHPEALEACNHEVGEKEDGFFWMTWHEFKQGFKKFHLNLQASRTEGGDAELPRYDQIETGHVFSEEELAVSGHVWDGAPADDDEDSEEEIVAATGEDEDAEVVAKIEELMEQLKTKMAQLQETPPGDERKEIIKSISRKGRRLAVASELRPMGVPGFI